VTELRDWPIERPPRLRPWFFMANGYLGVLFKDPQEAERARHGLLAHGVPEADVRLYTSVQILDMESRLDAERSLLAKALAALTADQAARTRYLDNAAAGGAALWLYAPTEDDADRLIRTLADYPWRSLRYYSHEGTEDILRDPG
jgi:hypothetical protein